MSIRPSKSINLFDHSVAKDSNFFKGTYNFLNRNLNIEPFIPGYAFWIWTRLPKWVLDVYPSFKEMTEKNITSVSSPADIELNTAAVNYGFANNEYHVATTLTKGNTDVTLKFGKEQTGLIFSRMFSYWVSGIRDPETGIATYPKIHGMNYAAKNHTAEAIYIVTRPDADNVDMPNIEFAAYWTALLPKKIALGSLGFDLGGHDPVDFECGFSGVFHMSPLVEDYAIIKLKEAYGFRTLEQFDPQDPGSGPDSITGKNEVDDGAAISGQAVTQY